MKITVTKEGEEKISYVNVIDFDIYVSKDFYITINEPDEKVLRFQWKQGEWDKIEITKE
ncbi:hypothetical protein ES702_07581 [subsurface metagenome]